jgi:hypothetical protein
VTTTATFNRLNHGWNAEPNSPDPHVSTEGRTVFLDFALNHFLFPQFEEGQRGRLEFRGCERYRLGSTNDEGWYRGQCRFSTLAPSWGEFYEIAGDSQLLDAPTDWRRLSATSTGALRHFLFYFRDNTFECVASELKIAVPFADTNRNVVRLV